MAKKTSNGGQLWSNPEKMREAVASEHQRRAMAASAISSRRAGRSLRGREALRERERQGATRGAEKKQRTQGASTAATWASLQGIRRHGGASFGEEQGLGRGMGKPPWGAR